MPNAPVQRRDDASPTRRESTIAGLGLVAMATAMVYAGFLRFSETNAIQDDCDVRPGHVVIVRFGGLMCVEAPKH